MQLIADEVERLRCAMWGTVYQLDEIASLAETGHEHEMKVHMDGARFANAMAARLSTGMAELPNIELC